jgi:hypothetical protein
VPFSFADWYGAMLGMTKISAISGDRRLCPIVPHAESSFDVASLCRERSAHVSQSLEIQGVGRNVARKDQAHLLFDLRSLMSMVYVFDGLFESNGKEQTNGNRGDVDEKILPRVDDLMGGVHIKHRR